MEGTLKLLFQRKRPSGVRQAAIGDLSLRDRIFPRSRRLRGRDMGNESGQAPW